MFLCNHHNPQINFQRGFDAMSSTSARVCPYSMVSYDEHDEAIVRLLAVPVTDQIIHYVACKLTGAVNTLGNRHLPTPPVTPIRGKFALNSAPCSPECEFPPLEIFLKDLVARSHIHTASVLGSMIYLKRITKCLQSGNMKHGPETPYRLAVALFTVASKYSHDVSPSTAHWAGYTAAALGESAMHSTGRISLTWISVWTRRDCCTGARCLVSLDFNMRFDEEDLRDCLNGLSSHERAEGPLKRLRLGQGRPKPWSMERYSLSVKSSSAPRSTVKSGGGVAEGSRKAFIPSPITLGYQKNTSLASPPCTPVRGVLDKEHTIEKSFPATNSSKLDQRARPLLEVNTSPQAAWINSHFLGPLHHTPYPQLNPDMNASYLSRLIDRSELKSTIAPIGVPSAPPSTPIAGVKSLPFIYGGDITSPELSSLVVDTLVAAPDKDSPWTRGQVGEILRKTMAHQARQLASLSRKENRDITLLNTPSFVPIFGSGLLYKQDAGQSSIEPARMAKLTISDLRWYYALKRPIPTDMLDGELSRDLKAELLRLGIPVSQESHGLISIDTTVERSHPVALALGSSAPSSSPAHVRPILKATLDKRIYCHVRGRHYKAVVDSGPADLLNTRWDKKLQAGLEAKGLNECEQQFKTTAPLRLGKNKDTINRRIRHINERLPLEGEKSARRAAIGESMVDRTVAELPDSRLDQKYCHVDRITGLQESDTGVSFVPAPGKVSVKEPENIGWLSRLLGGSIAGVAT
ncbi:Cyclin [Rhizoctonia solani]|uniref:Cyclin n=1 Tax=Rhizoctonia solani TaxID=456999 RepID=A0A8H7IKV8_9AGAM|nr:Cyclin [Rhizoctonia solani]